MLQLANHQTLHFLLKPLLNSELLIESPDLTTYPNLGSLWGLLFSIWMRVIWKIQWRCSKNRPKRIWLCFNFKKSLSCLFLQFFNLKPKASFVMSATVRLILVLMKEPYQFLMACWNTLHSLLSLPDLISKAKTINCLLTVWKKCFVYVLQKRRHCLSYPWVKHVVCEGMHWNL